MEILEKTIKFLSDFKAPFPHLYQKDIGEPILKALVELMSCHKFNSSALMKSVDDNCEFISDEIRKRRPKGKMEWRNIIMRFHNIHINPGRKRIQMDETYKGKDLGKLWS